MIDKEFALIGIVTLSLVIGVFCYGVFIIAPENEKRINEYGKQINDSESCITLSISGADAIVFGDNFSDKKINEHYRLDIALKEKELGCK